MPLRGASERVLTGPHSYETVAQSTNNQGIAPPQTWDAAGLGPASALVSAVTIAELAFGLDVEDLIERRARTDRFYTVLQELAVLSFDVAAARTYGTLAATVRRGGRNPRPRRMELQIAATAVTHGLPLVTRNPADFAGLEDHLRLVPV